MGVERSELDEAQWTRIEPLLPGTPSDPVRTGSSNRLYVNRVLRALRSSARQQYLPMRYGKWKTAKKHFSRQAGARVRARVFDDLIKDRNNLSLMLGSTLVRAHQQTTTVLHWGMLHPSKRSPKAKFPATARPRIASMTIASAVGPTPHDTNAVFECQTEPLRNGIVT
jgi:putative transposase